MSYAPEFRGNSINSLSSLTINASGFIALGTSSAINFPNDATGLLDAKKGTVSNVNIFSLAGSTSGVLTFNVPSAITSYAILWPAAQSSGSKFLNNDGAGNLSWSAAGGTNQTLSNLTSPTAINQSLLPSGSFNLGSNSAFWTALYADAVNFPTPGSAVISNLNSLVWLGSTSGTLTMNVPATITPYSVIWPAAQSSGAQFLRNDGSGNLSWTTVSIPASANPALSNLSSVAINTSLLPGIDDTIDVGSASFRIANMHTVSDLWYGAISGVLTQNAAPNTTSYSVFWPPAQASGIQVLQNDGLGTLSWATVSASGANQSLSNLTNPTAVNQSLIPAAGKALGTFANPWDALYLNTNDTGTGGLQINLARVDGDNAGDINFSRNLKYDGSNWRYIVSGNAQILQLASAAGLTFYDIASGVAGAIAPIGGPQLDATINATTASFRGALSASNFAVDLSGNGVFGGTVTATELDFSTLTGNIVGKPGSGSAGGAVALKGGIGSSSQNGGAVTITAGKGNNNTSPGGGVVLGGGGSTGTGGNASLNAGDAASGSSQAGGQAQVNGGNGAAGNTGGDVVLSGGTGEAGVTNPAGLDLQGGGISGAAGSAILQAGDGVEAIGGDVVLQAGNANTGVAANFKGGDIVLTTGTPTGTGTPGKVVAYGLPLPKIQAAVITFNGSAYIVGGANNAWITNAAKNSTGNVTLTFTGFDEAPAIVITGRRSAGVQHYILFNIESQSSTSVTLQLYDGTGSFLDFSFNIVAVS